MASTEEKRRRRAEGLCTYCAEPAVYGRALCEKHLRSNVKATLKQKRKRIAEGRCWGCGRRRLTEGLAASTYWCPKCAAYTSDYQMMHNVY